MVRKEKPTREDMIRAEREIGENLPDRLHGVEGADVGEVKREGGRKELPPSRAKLSPDDVDL